MHRLCTWCHTGATNAQPSRVTWSTCHRWQSSCVLLPPSINSICDNCGEPTGKKISILLCKKKKNTKNSAFFLGIMGNQGPVSHGRNGISGISSSKTRIPALMGREKVGNLRSCVIGPARCLDRAPKKRENKAHSAHWCLHQPLGFLRCVRNAMEGSIYPSILSYLETHSLPSHLLGR